jgi:hypothetical protein
MIESGSVEQVKKVKKIKEFFDQSIVFIFSFLLKNISQDETIVEDELTEEVQVGAQSRYG